MLHSARTSRRIAGLALSLLLAGIAVSACHLTAEIGQPTIQTRSAVATATPGPGIETDQTRTSAGLEIIPEISPAFNRSILSGDIPTISPTLTPAPTLAPTVLPTTEPTAAPQPTAAPTPKPTATPRPTATPTPKPTAAPAFDPVHLPGVPANWPTSASQQKKIDTFIALVNKARVEAGLPTLAAGGAALQEMAAIRAAEISLLFSHTRPTDVTTCDQWSELMKIMGIRFLAAGENIAGINTPEAAMDAFMNSDGHRKNILGANYRKIAIGVYTDQSGKDWWAQEFTD